MMVKVSKWIKVFNSLDNLPLFVLIGTWAKYYHFSHITLKSVSVRSVIVQLPRLWTRLFIETEEYHGDNTPLTFYNTLFCFFIITTLTWHSTLLFFFLITMLELQCRVAVFESLSIALTCNGWKRNHDPGPGIPPNRWRTIIHHMRVLLGCLWCCPSRPSMSRTRRERKKKNLSFETVTLSLLFDN